MRIFYVMLFPSLLLLPPSVASSHDAPLPLERALVRRASEVMKFLRDHRCENVGVLKFLITKDGKKFSDNVGTMNLLLARQVETALIVSNDPNKPLGIIEDANSVAAKIRGANHLSRQGREALFRAEYPLAWGKDKVTPDAFITGTAEIGDDLKTVTISLLAFTRKDNKLIPLGKDFEAALRPNHLVELGESYLLRGLVEGGKVEVVDKGARILEQAHKTRQEQVKHPVEMAEQAPVRLQVLYDGEIVNPEVKDGRAMIPEPKEGQKVELVLKSTARKGRYGVVLKVNGENTSLRQRLPDLYCSMWVMESGEGPYTFKGFHMDEKTVQEFRVASAEESRAREINYGPEVGTITMTVFREAGAKPKQPLEEARLYESVVEKVYRPKEKASNYNALKAQLLDDANRSLIVDGKTIEGESRTVTFYPDPDPS